MAEVDVKDIKLMEYNVAANGVIKLDNEEVNFFEKEVWKLFVNRMGWKIIDEQKKKVFGECMIQFFPLERRKLIESARHNKTFLMKNLMNPLFYIKYDKTQYVELIDRSGEKIPKDLFFMILCR